MEQTYIDYIGLSETLNDYASPRSHVAYLSRKGKLIRVRRGLYVPGDTTGVSLMTLANKIYGPSYVSFESALSHHGLIPERTETVTSASMGKNKSKLFKTPLGAFSYRSVPSEVFPYGVERSGDEKAPFLIASPEKALCDLIAKSASAVPSGAQLERFLLEDLRIDSSSIARLDIREVAVIAQLYEKRTVTLLAEYLKHRRRLHGGS
ncbi:MAG TPA: hypothetical protein DEE98_04545 [Elusimicrobia bacterium]|nr:MAG: hypothetical protein A2278_04235 [Elusimicrobia bacterium RIFOXYA12_FULL_49_49]OGS09781.1 MAG: hypothetical protein A2204_01255 [Elusimicrobia bacterium RIFOXYA1_FULL_47_7]OGS10517.1 MAG: hypothetical protein A2386_05435 [Elusimicrobia bacterium RIFOXYB1_FULL_48_9]OGS14741.1 MAG: hypothetical protein A2251_09610 [Elusimicrobia bacterium RIFOXYA2_FULL_47_53]OGS25607.1 MAG: hypothetical protein A2339_05980 [Elusimicrobia bacterium RIFOXYB12_FULL_50_12]OGS31832.1 MAG: hypothetical protein